MFKVKNKMQIYIYIYTDDLTYYSGEKSNERGYFSGGGGGD